MGGPELNSDEKILITTQDVFVKSIPFEAILTSKRIILIDRKKNLIPTKDILLATVRGIEEGENAIRDQFINLSLITSNGEGRQLALTFTRTAGGSRKRERDEWVKLLKDLTSSSIQQTIRKVVPSFDEEPRKITPEQATPGIGITARPSGKKEIETAQPIKKIIETGPVPPKPVETTSLPTGSFCSRCGNRIPADSVFCNKCGAKVTQPGQEVPAAVPSIPQVSVDSPMPPVKQPPVEHRERPIDKEIQSIEPLIEGSVPRTAEAPPVQTSKAPEQPTPQPVAADAASAIAQAAQSIIDGLAPAPAGVPPADTAGKVAGEKSIIPEIFLKKDLPSQPAPAGTPVPTPPPARPPAPKGRSLIMIAIAVIVVIAIAGGVFLYWNQLKGSGVVPSEGNETITVPTTAATPTPSPTRVPTTAATVVTTPATPAQTQVPVPKQGVWVRIIYSGPFRGTAGTAAQQDPVSDTGDKFYSVPTSEGIVQASIQKRDGTGNELVVEVYKNGSLVKRESTTVPWGFIDIQADLRPPATTTIPTTKPVSPPVTTKTVNTTATTLPA
jgi:hypothetical protein